jgi:hypothetical protein
MKRILSADAFSLSMRLTAVCLGVTVLSLPTFASDFCITHLKGKSYASLPKNLCPRYTDMLLGHTAKQQEYSGVLCDRPEASYIFLQRLLRHNAQGKAVWQVIEIKTVDRPNPQSLLLGTGCQPHLSGKAPLEPIFALVQPTASRTYQTLAAWKVNLSQESFTELEPQQVVCKDIAI